MNKVYTTQDFLRIESYYIVSPGTITNAYIKYRTPLGVVGQYTATHDEANKMFYYNLPADTYLSPAGTWTFWNYAEMSDGRFIPGSEWTWRVYNEGLSQ